MKTKQGRDPRKPGHQEMGEASGATHPEGTSSSRFGGQAWGPDSAKERVPGRKGELAVGWPPPALSPRPRRLSRDCIKVAVDRSFSRTPDRSPSKSAVEELLITPCSAVSHFSNFLCSRAQCLVKNIQGDEASERREGREQALKQTRRVSDDEFSGADFKAAILTCGGIWIFMSEGRVCKKTGLHPLVCTEQIQKDNLEAED